MYCVTRGASPDALLVGLAAHSVCTYERVISDPLRNIPHARAGTTTPCEYLFLSLANNLSEQHTLHDSPGALTMTLQNRVTPEGVIVAHPSRGTLMGNRGCLHDEQGHIVRTSKRDTWVTCLLEFEGRKRPLMQAGCYTELFFLDEPTALAAGHRPCSECRRDRYIAFRAAWSAPSNNGKPLTAREIDAQLKRERTNPSQANAAPLISPPDGLIVKQLPSNDYYLIHSGRALLWGFGGYKQAIDLKKLAGPLRIITPASSASALSRGYNPELHESCRALLR